MDRFPGVLPPANFRDASGVKFPATLPVSDQPRCRVGGNTPGRLGPTHTPPAPAREDRNARGGRERAEVVGEVGLHVHGEQHQSWPHCAGQFAFGTAAGGAGVATGGGVFVVLSGMAGIAMLVLSGVGRGGVLPGK